LLACRTSKNHRFFEPTKTKGFCGRGNLISSGKENVAHFLKLRSAAAKT
jgi:hypothetical protein